MSFVDRLYPDIVRDVLTNLTQGVTAEVHAVAYDPAARPLVVPDIVLARRPVRRVSMVRGFVAGPGPDDPPVATLFSLNDYQLVPNPDDPGDVSRIRFMPLARNKPASGTDVTVNYYPRTTDPTPLTDLNVGSVTRTIVEAMGRELAALYAQLNIAYDSGFVETATGASLDRVVALLSYQRFRAGRATGSVTFSRRAGETGAITIPAGTPVTDTTDKVRYLTAERYDMLAGESTAEVRVRGASTVAPVVADGVLSVMQRAIAGLDKVTNARPTGRATDDETDEALRARARDALLAASKGTLEAMRNGLLAVTGVRDLVIVEMPNGVPGEIRVTVSLTQPSPPGADLPPEVLARIEELRPAGIRVLRGQAAPAAVAASIALVLAGSQLAPAEIEAVRKGVRDRLVAAVSQSGVGELLRAKRLTAALLSDPRIADLTLAIGAKGTSPAEGADFQPAADAGITLDPGDIAFGPNTYAKAATAAGQGVTVEVRAMLGVLVNAGTTPDAARTELTALVTAYLATLKPGASIDADSMRAALKNDVHYALDPLKFLVTLTAQDQFVQIAQGGQAYQVKPGQSFALTSVDLS